MRLIAFLFALFAMSQPAIAGSAHGSATYREALIMPAGSTFQVELYDRANGGRQIGESSLPAEVGPPYNFAVHYDDGAVVERGEYQIQIALTLPNGLQYTFMERLAGKADGTLPFVEAVLTRASTTGSSSENDKIATLEGTALYRERIMPPETSKFVATMYRVDGGQRELGSVTMAGANGPPYRFEVPYYPSEMVPTDKYGVTVELIDNGRPIFASGTGFEGFSDGQQPEINLTMSAPVATTPPILGVKPPASLTNTYWKIVSLNGEPLQVIEREPQLKFTQGEDLTYAGTVGCNRIRGGMSVEGNAIRFEPSASTMAACPDPISGYERSLSGVLDQARTYAIQGDNMRLLSQSGQVIARLRAVYF